MCIHIQHSEAAATEYEADDTPLTPVISLWQPWASALFALRPDGRPIKPNETRHWSLPIRFIGVEVAIHAAKRDTLNEREFWQNDVLDSPYREIYDQGFKPLGISCYTDLPRGCIVGTVVFGPSVATAGQFFVEEIAAEWGNYSLGRFAWPTVKRTHFSQPIPCVGRQGFFTARMPPQS